MSKLLQCLECKSTPAPDYLGDHLLEAHGLSVTDYLAKYPGAQAFSERLLARFGKERKQPAQRVHPPFPENLTIPICGMPFSVHCDVPADACLPMPPAYRLPTHGNLARDVRHALISFRKRRSQYIWGLPGSGKDAFFHAMSAMTRIPGLERQIKPGVDIQAWFYTRAFNKDGTYWEEGPLLKALRDGYVVKNAQGQVIKRIPYLILFTDFDRADRAQAEHMRLLTDSIKGRVEGPQGQTYPVMEGTIICATGNTAGSGDNRGRCVSANVIDASILDRFQRVYQFSWMDWEDEVEIVREKFPLLVERAPWIFAPMGKVTFCLREAILKDEMYAEFSHRALCTILEHAQDIIETSADVPANILKTAARAWLDRLPDATTQEQAKTLMDPHFKGGMLDEGDTSFMASTPIV